MDRWERGRLRRRIERAIAAAVVLAVVGTFELGLASSGGARRVPPPIGVDVFPAAGSTLSGYQDVVVTYARSSRARVTAAIYGAPGRLDRIVPNDAIRHEPDGDHLLICAECVGTRTLSLRLEFGARWRALNETYPVHLRPDIVVNAQANADRSMVLLDASRSRSLLGGKLTFSWIRAQGPPVFGPTLAMPAPEPGLFEPALLRVTDERLSFYTLVYVDVERQSDGSYKPVAHYKEEHLKCTALKVADSGASVLNPAISLGPTLKKGDSVPLDANNKTTSNALLFYRFEVRGTIVPDKDSVLLEGQDAAGTFSNPSPGVTNNGPKKGHERKSHKPGDYGKEQVETPFPANPSGSSPPKMSQDDYEYHPDVGKTFIIKDGRLVELPLRAKDFGQDPDSGNIDLVWFDDPGIVIKKGSDMSHGASARAYFDAWMDPDYSVCHKRFTIEMEIDKTGKVTTSALTMLSLT